MRPIKYRAWELPRTEEYCKNVGLSFNPNFKGAMHYDVQKWTSFCHMIDSPEDWILMEFTGLHDKNGKEIWEGDVVSASAKSGITIKSVVRFFVEYGLFGLSMVPHYYNQKTDNEMPLGSSGSSTPYKPFTWKSYKSIEVLGNIYEHPHLLGEKK